MSAARTVMDFWLPRQCPLCRAPHGRDAEFCFDCERELVQSIDTPFCIKCSITAAYPGAPCPHCRGRGLPPYRSIRGLGMMRGHLKSLVHRAKYSGRWQVGETLADLACDARDLANWLKTADALVAVPLHASRQVERGFNQAEVIARRIGRRCGVRVIEPVVRVRPTAAQAALHARHKRIDNLADAFVVTDPLAVAGKHLVVVDDVMTTGATLVSLARALESAGDVTLSAIVLCHADPKGRQFEFI